MTLVIIFIILWNNIYIPYICNFSVFVVVIFQIFVVFLRKHVENLFFSFAEYICLCVGEFQKIQSNGS